MSGRNVDFGDRLATAAAAKQALLEKAKAKANDPELIKKQAERAAVAAAREAREAERREAKRLEDERIAAELAAAKEAADAAAAGGRRGCSRGSRSRCGGRSRGGRACRPTGRCQAGPDRGRAEGRPRRPLRRPQGAQGQAIECLLAECLRALRPSATHAG